ncbi:WXG100 family type VII secretion target [Streptomyces wedmorensis]|uniref:WXG100 family type VII secretion target n=1 Tax=Streptomyces wedmorensis TaxID=43759 RepID=UPI0037A75BE9
MDRPDLAVPEDDGLTRLADDLGAMQQHLNDKVRQMDGIVDRIQSRWQGATGEAYRGLQREVAQDAVRVRERLRVLEEAIRLSRDGFTEQELDALQAMRRVESGTDVAREAEALQSPTAAPPPDPVKEVQGMKPSVDPGGFPSGFDVSPTHVWYASYLIRNLQTAFNRPPGRLLDTLDDHKHVCGIGSGPSAFVAAYTEISALCLEVRALAVVAVGGVSTGLTITANNYVRAEYASIPGGGAPTSLKAVPDVIRQPPHHGRAADLGWAGSGRGADRRGEARGNGCRRTCRRWRNGPVRAVRPACGGRSPITSTRGRGEWTPSSPRGCPASGNSAGASRSWRACWASASARTASPSRTPIWPTPSGSGCSSPTATDGTSAPGGCLPS